MAAIALGQGSTRTREIHPPPTHRRRDYSDADKRRIIAEASRDNALVSGVARQYGISSGLLFRWRKKFGMEPMYRIVPVTISDMPDGLVDLSAITPAPTQSAPAVVERAAPAIEIELRCGRRFRFERDTDPEVNHVGAIALDLRGNLQNWS